MDEESDAVRKRRTGEAVDVFRALPRWWPFPLWLGAFYLVWALIVFGGGWWTTVTEHWQIAAAMAAGSYVAGSTPMGGGTIGFPILTLLLDQSADIGRTFSFAVQSIGMTSASIFILATGRPVALRLLRWSMIGAVIGTPIGLALLAPIVPGEIVKVLFAVVWASFGVMTLAKVFEFARVQGITPVEASFDRAWGLFIGVFGGLCVASLTGVGIDMLLYTALVLVRRADLRIAIPTSVVIMAFTSLVGLASSVILEQADPARYAISPEVFYNWMAAAPIVALGAPFGAFIVSIVSRTPTLIFVSILCIGQFIWTCVDLRLPFTTIAIASGGVVIANGVFHLLYRYGKRLAVRAATAGASSAAAAR